VLGFGVFGFPLGPVQELGPCVEGRQAAAGRGLGRAMAPKKEAKVTKAAQAQRQKVVEDKTFGLKNKNKSKAVQGVHRDLQSSVNKPDAGRSTSREARGGQLGPPLPPPQGSPLPFPGWLHPATGCTQAAGAPRLCLVGPPGPLYPVPTPASWCPL